MRSTAIRWNFREYRFRFTLQFLSLQSVPIGTVSIQGFTPFGFYRKCIGNSALKTEK
jgi:hypothetical protein